MSTANFNHPSWRRIICQLREIFNELHAQVAASKDEDKYKSEQINLSDICLDASQKYISVIENELKLIGESSEEEALIKESFRLLLKVWKLCQIIFIKSSPSGTLLVDLQEWYRSTNNIDPMVQELFANNAAAVDRLHLDENYWLLILVSVAQGRIDTTRHLLSFHPSKNTSAFRAVDEQLRAMPNFQTMSHLSLFEFKAKWEYWQKKCIQVLTNEDFSHEETGSLELICKMMCADESTFIDLKPIFHSWYYMLISLVSYSNPTFNISDLHLHLASKTCMKQFENDLEEFDAIIHNIFDFDVEVVIRDCVQLFGNNLFSAHLLDILYLNGKLQLNKHDVSLWAATGGSASASAAAAAAATRGVGSSGVVRLNGAATSSHLLTAAENAALVHEQHLFDYGVQLLNASWSTGALATYETGFDYLVKCTRLDTTGLETIEAYVERFPLTHISEREADRLFHLAASRFGMHDTAFSIGRVLQTRALKRGLYGTALGWNVRIKDSVFGTVLAERILEQYFATEQQTLLELTDNLSKEIIYCDRLIFLNKYAEFVRSVRQSQASGLCGSANTAERLAMLKQAGTLLVQLIEAPKLVPFKYRKRIMFELFKLTREDVFDEKQIVSILNIIQAYENRRDIFREDRKFNRPNSCGDNANSLPTVDDHRAEATEVDSCFDVNSWADFLNELSVKLADCFLNSQVEICS